MKKIVFILSIIFIIFIINDIYSQEIGTIKVGTHFDEKKMELENEGTVFRNPPEISILFETYKGSFELFKIRIRVIKFENESETIYKSEEHEIDPDWNWYSTNFTLPSGKFRFKIYTNEGNLLAKSLLIDIR